MKPEVNFYPMIDLFDVEKYLSDLYGEEIDLLITLFGDDVSNDIYMDYSIEEPEKEYVEVEWETEKIGICETSLKSIFGKNFLILRRLL